jgi:hypothetical protein
MADLLDDYEAKTGHSVPIHGTSIPGITHIILMTEL